MSTLFNRVKFTTATTGTSTMTVGPAVAGYLTPDEAGVPNGATVSYVAEDADGANMEVGRGVYNSSSITITRPAVLVSKVLGEAPDTVPLSLSGSAVVYLTAVAEDLLTRTAAIADNALVRGDGGAAGVQSSGITIDDSNNITGVANITLASNGANVAATIHAFNFQNYH